MNYSASETYWKKCREFDKKKISRSKIRKRWFRNYYALHQLAGSFTHRSFVLKAGKFDPKVYAGDFYGPFFNYETAHRFGLLMCDVHTSFILG